MTVADVNAAAVMQMRTVYAAAAAKRQLAVAERNLVLANDANRAERAQEVFDARATYRVAVEMAKAAERIYRAECRRVDLVPPESAQARLFEP